MSLPPAQAPVVPIPPVRVWRSRLLEWLFLSSLCIALSVLSAAQNVAFLDIGWRVALGFALLDWGPWIVLSPIVLSFGRRVQIDAHNWMRAVPLHVIAAFLIAIFFNAFSQFAIEHQFVSLPQVRSSRERRPTQVPPPRSPATPAQRMPRPRYIRVRFSIPIYCALVAAAHAIAYHRRSLERERRALAAEARLTEARLMALQTQINPHFLFNTLNTVSSLIYTQPGAADEMICALSELLRRVLAVTDRREILLAEELTFVDQYLKIQRIRFADRLDVRREIAPGLERASVPPLILQPLVENAVLHGIAPHATPGIVTLRASAEGGRLTLEVSDTGPGGGADGTPVRATERVGLTNTRARLAALYGDNARFELSRALEGGMRARIALPLRPEVAA